MPVPSIHTSSTRSRRAASWTGSSGTPFCGPEGYGSRRARREGRAPPPFPAKLVEAGGRKVRPRDAAETAVLRAAVENGPFVVREVRKKLRRRQAPAPFTTSKLQQEASKALRMQAYRTMMVAQSLYEGGGSPGAGAGGLLTPLTPAFARAP